MEVYSFALVIEDVLPVILSAIALYILANMIAKMYSKCALMAYFGLVLVTIGGLTKVAWKLILALSGGELNIALLDNALFFFLAPGFILITFALWYAQGNLAGKAKNKIWFVPTSLILLTLGLAFGTSLMPNDANSDSPAIWFFIMLAVATLFNFSSIGLAIRQAGSQRKWLAVGLLSINILAIIILQGLARAGDDSEAGQWVAQIVNTISQIGFIYAVWLLAGSTQALLEQKLQLKLQAI